MNCGKNLLAWIETRGADEFLAAFVGEGAMPDPVRGYPGRRPAECVFASHREAQRWVEDQASTFGLPVKWIGRPQR